MVKCIFIAIPRSPTVGFGERRVRILWHKTTSIEAEAEKSRLHPLTIGDRECVDGVSLGSRGKHEI